MSELPAASRGPTTGEPRYWLSCGDGREYGPYTVDALRRFVDEGRVTADCMVCAADAVGRAPHWVPVNTVLGVGVAPPISPPQVTPRPINRRLSLVPSIAATIASLLFCCIPVGIPALVYAMQANARFEAGDEEGGLRSERHARGWLIAAWVLVAIGFVMSAVTLYGSLEALDSLLRMTPSA